MSEPAPPASPLERGLGWGLVLLGLVLTTWPLALAPASMVLGTPNLEAVDHLWSLWAGLHDGPLIIETGLVRHPEGYTWVLADPVNLVFFALPALLGGAALGFHAVHLGNLIVAGLGAVALGRELLPGAARAPWLTMLVASTAAPLCAGLFTGMTEAQTWGWIGLALAAVHRSARTGRLRDILLAGLASGICAWCGVYTALYAAFAALPVIVAGLLRGEGRWGARLGGLLGSGLVVGLMAAPVAWAVTTARGDDLPGSSSLTAEVLRDPSLPQNRMLGADLLGVFGPLPSPAGAELHAVYLGAVAWGLLLLALVVLRKRPWGLLVSIGVLVSLGLGLFLQAGGEVILTGDGRPLLTPAGWLSLWFEPLGRAPRWYRAVAVAGILMAPLAGAGGAWLLARLPRGARPVGMVALASLILVDALQVSPLTWPRDSFDADPPDGYELLDTPGPLIEVPSVRFSTVVPGRPATASGGGLRRPEDPIRHPSLLWQTSHEHPLGGNPHQAERRRTSRESSKAVDKLLDAAVTDREGKVQQAWRSLQKLGFVWLVHHPTAHPEEVQEGLREWLGEPAVDTEELLAWEIPPLEE